MEAPDCSFNFLILAQEDCCRFDVLQIRQKPSRAAEMGSLYTVKVSTHSQSSRSILIVTENVHSKPPMLLIRQSSPSRRLAPNRHATQESKTRTNLLGYAPGILKTGGNCDDVPRRAILCPSGACRHACWGGIIVVVLGGWVALLDLLVGVDNEV